MSSNLIANSRWNLLAFAFTLAAHFITVPFVVSHIGLTDFGRAGLVLAAWAPLLMVGNVIGQAATARIAEHLGAGDTASARRAARSASFLCLVSIAVVLAAAAAFGPSILRSMVDDPQAVDRWYHEAVAAGLGWAAQQLALVVQGICAAHQEYKTVARASAFSAVATIAATLAVTTLWPNSLGYLCGVSASFVLGATIWWLAVGLRWDLDLLRPRLEPTELRQLLRFGKWQTFAQLANTIGNQTDRYVLGVMAPASIVGQYNAVNRLQEAAYVSIVKAGEVLFPHFGAAAQQDPLVQTRLYLVATWVVMSFSATVLAPLICLAHPLVLLWAGPEVANGGSLLLQTLVLGGLIGCGSNVTTYYFLGTGQVSILALMSLVYSVSTIGLSIVLMVLFGPYAAGAGLAIASVVRVVLSMAFLQRRFVARIRGTDLLIANALPLAVGIAIAAVSVLGWPVETSRNWIMLIAAYAGLSLAVLSTIVALTALSRFGRDMLQQIGRRILPAATSSGRLEP